MGILPRHLHVFAMEHKTHAFSGRTLTLGQQYVYSSLKDVEDILSAYGAVKQALNTDFNTNSIIKSSYNHTNAYAVFTLIGSKEVLALDISDYQRADIIADLNYDIDTKYHNSFDNIVDVGTLEHIFDIPIALKNIISMLRVGGNIALCLPSSNSIDHGFYSFSPTFLYDFFDVNGFGNFSCYLSVGNPMSYLSKGKLYKYTGLSRECPILTAFGVEVFFFATKESEVDTVTKPQQRIYAEMQQKLNNPDKSKVVVRSAVATLYGAAKRYKLIPYFLQRLINQYRSGNIEFIGKF